MSVSPQASDTILCVTKQGKFISFPLLSLDVLKDDEVLFKDIIPQVI